MKTFKQFQEDYTKVINPVKPVTDLIGAGLGAYELGKKALSGLSNIFQARKKGKFQRKEMKGRVGDNQKIKPKLLDAIRKKQREMLGKTDDKLNTPTDLPNFDGKKIDTKTRKRMNAPENQFNSYDPLEEEAPTNNVGGGQIAGTVEAGDDPPVKKKKKKGKKKKRYIYGGRGSRKMWMPEKDK